MYTGSWHGAGRISARGAEGRRLPLMWIGVEKSDANNF